MWGVFKLKSAYLQVNWEFVGGIGWFTILSAICAWLKPKAGTWMQTGFSFPFMRQLVKGIVNILYSNIGVFWIDSLSHFVKWRIALIKQKRTWGVILKFRFKHHDFIIIRHSFQLSIFYLFHTYPSPKKFLHISSTTMYRHKYIISHNNSNSIAHF